MERSRVPMLRGRSFTWITTCSFTHLVFQIKNTETFFLWMDQYFLPNYYPVLEYNGKRLHWSVRQFITDSVSFRVGPAMLRQVRSKTGEMGPGGVSVASESFIDMLQTVSSKLAVRSSLPSLNMSMPLTASGQFPLSPFACCYCSL